MSLHPKQIKLLELLEKNQEDAFSISQLAEALNFESNNSLRYHLQQLEKKGFLQRNIYNSANYKVTREDDEKTYVNFYGQAQCGRGGCIVSDDPETRIPISSKLINFHPQKAFMIKARGDSMNPIIAEGDLVIVQRKEEFFNDDVVVCSINDGEVMIKQYMKEKNSVLLKSFNRKKHPPITISKEESSLLLIGKVEQVIRNRVAFS